jgi:hypothetical protein
MEKYYLCSAQSKTNANQNETLLVPAEDVADFISSYLAPDCVLIFSSCTTFKTISKDDEK